LFDGWLTYLVINTFKPGDTMNLAAGTYSNLSVSASVGGGAMIGATSGCCNVVEIATSSYVTIKNPTIVSTVKVSTDSSE
jgi:hypothetical protein